VTITSHDLLARVRAHGIVLTAHLAGFSFSENLSVFRRRWILRDDRAVMPDMRMVSVVCADEAEMAASVAGHLAELGASPLWLWPNGEKIPHDKEAASQAWRDAIAATGSSDASDKSLDVVSVAIELRAGAVVLPRVIAALLRMPEVRRTLLFADGPLVVSIVPPCQVWMDSTDPRLLPAIALTEPTDRRPAVAPVLSEVPVVAPTAAESERCATLLRDLGVADPLALVGGMPWQPEASDLVVVEAEMSKREQRMTPNAATAWRDMQRAAAGDRVTLQLVSAFRGVEYQREIWARKLSGGQTPAQIRAASAPPGYSEHHTGCAIDITTPTADPLTEAFADTRAFVWLTLHAAEFGFRMTYPRGNPFGVMFEPWHWMWVGRADDAPPFEPSGSAIR